MSKDSKVMLYGPDGLHFFGTISVTGKISLHSNAGRYLHGTLNNGKIAMHGPDGEFYHGTVTQRTLAVHGPEIFTCMAHSHD
jgi:hypothetical protein